MPSFEMPATPTLPGEPAVAGSITAGSTRKPVPAAPRIALPLALSPETDPAVALTTAALSAPALSPAAVAPEAVAAAEPAETVAVAADPAPLPLPVENRRPGGSE